MPTDAFHREHVFIGGEWSTPASDGVIDAVNASTEEHIGWVPRATVGDVDRAVRAARSAFDDGSWASWPVEARVERIRALLAALESRADIIARLVSMENGQPIVRAPMVQVYGPIAAAREMLDVVAELRLVERREGVRVPGTLYRRPVGVVGAIIPWNAPLFLTLLKIVPALTVGCTVVVKAAPETPLDAYQLADACAEAGFPPGVVSVLVGDRDAGRALVEHPGVDKIAFTGSTATGRWIMGRLAERIGRVTLELGGKSAAVVLDDVDLDAVLQTLSDRMTMLSGQICVSLSRILVPRGRHDEIAQALADTIASQKVGDPLDPDTVMGPLVSARHRERVQGYIDLGRAEGARPILGGSGRPPAGLDRGWYVEPTLYADVGNHFRIAQEEIFGPVWCVIPYDDDDQAVRLANDSIYGLAGAVFTSDLERGRRLAAGIMAGTVGINGWTNDPRFPVGGFKQSGLGREQDLDGYAGYLETQVVLEFPSVP